MAGSRSPARIENHLQHPTATPGPVVRLCTPLKIPPLVSVKLAGLRRRMWEVLTCSGSLLFHRATSARRRGDDAERTHAPCARGRINQAPPPSSGGWGLQGRTWCALSHTVAPRPNAFLATLAGAPGRLRSLPGSCLLDALAGPGEVGSGGGQRLRIWIVRAAEYHSPRIREESA